MSNLVSNTCTYFIHRHNISKWVDSFSFSNIYTQMQCSEKKIKRKPEWHCSSDLISIMCWYHQEHEPSMQYLFHKRNYILRGNRGKPIDFSNTSLCCLKCMLVKASNYLDMIFLWASITGTFFLLEVSVTGPDALLFWECGCGKQTMWSSSSRPKV